MKKCTICDKEFASKGAKCFACIKRQQRATKLLELADNPSSELANGEPEESQESPKPTTPTQYFRAIKVTQDTEGAVKRSLSGGKSEWVIPGNCHNGQCLNPNCVTI